MKHAKTALVAFCFLLSLALWATSALAADFNETQRLAEQGDVASQFNLGRMYNNGEGVQQDKQKAVEWYQKAAKQGYDPAQTSLGWMYYKGEGVRQDMEKAVEWYQKAAEQGYAKAQYNLGLMYRKGEGVQQDKQKAVEWYQKAAEQGHAEAQFYLGIMYDDGEDVQQDKKKAVEWYQKATEQGVNIPEAYHYGYYVIKTGKLDGKHPLAAPQEYIDRCKAGLIHGINLYNLDKIRTVKMNSKWKKVMDECKELYAKNGTVLGPKAYAKVQEWKNRPHDMALLQDVNEYWNHSIEFRRDDPDTEKLLPDDIWSNPNELEERGGGDCEDYSIAKYYMLKELGFDTHDMRIVGGSKKDTGGHAVLGVWFNGDIWLLNNMRDIIIPHTQYDYTFNVSSCNEYGTWKHMPLTW